MKKSIPGERTQYIRRNQRNQRILANILFASIVVISFLFVSFTFPEGRNIGLFTILLGYLSLLFLFMSLLIGPLNLFRLRKNPVNIDLRRDSGIWAAITGCYHVALAFQERSGREFLGYFFKENSLIPWLNLFGLSNDSGLLATFLLVILLLLSNTFSLRLLKGKRWKLIQRSNYILVPLALVHTFGYQYLGRRESLFGIIVVGLSLLVLIFQGIGIALVLLRRKRRSMIPG
jgi:DMSO/TMAO reductase YedYZ heme-binding membrane subunit